MRVKECWPVFCIICAKVLIFFQISKLHTCMFIKMKLTITRLSCISPEVFSQERLRSKYICWVFHVMCLGGSCEVYNMKKNITNHCCITLGVCNLSHLWLDKSLINFYTTRWLRKIAIVCLGEDHTETTTSPWNLDLKLSNSKILDIFDHLLHILLTSIYSENNFLAAQHIAGIVMTPSQFFEITWSCEADAKLTDIMQLLQKDLLLL